MKKTALFLFLAIIGYHSFSQSVDSIKIFQSDTLVRGFCKNYQEFLYNNPSTRTKFTMRTKVSSKNDSSLLGTNLSFPGGAKKPDYIWGFSTGDEVFVRHSGASLKTYYWKLESIGTYSYFFAALDNSLAMIPLPGITGGIMILSPGKVRPKDAYLYVIDTTGKIRRANFSLIKKFLKPHPELLKSFKAAAEPYEEYEYGNRREDESADTQDIIIGIMRTYLDKLNTELNSTAKTTSGN